MQCISSSTYNRVVVHLSWSANRADLPSHLVVLSVHAVLWGCHANLTPVVHSKVIIAQDALVQTLIRHCPGPCTASFAAKQALRARRLLEHAVFFHRLHLVAGGVGEEVLEVLIFEGEGVAGDTCANISFLSRPDKFVERTYHGRCKAPL
jgi:hypothetical protein